MLYRILHALSIAHVRTLPVCLRRNHPVMTRHELSYNYSRPQQPECFFYMFGVLYMGTKIKPLPKLYICQFPTWQLTVCFVNVYNFYCLYKINFHILYIHCGRPSFLPMCLQYAKTRTVCTYTLTGPSISAKTPHHNTCYGLCRFNALALPRNNNICSRFPSAPSSVFVPTKCTVCLIPSM